MTDIWGIKEMIQCATLRIPKRIKKMQLLFVLLFALTLLSEMKV